MLFNSYVFIFGFLPVALLVFFQLGRRSPTLAAGWLAVASLFFYGWWNPAYVALLAVSILFNYAMGLAIVRAVAAGATRRARGLLAVAVSADLTLLGYYKYANFFLDNAGLALGVSFGFEAVVLPLGISFFTFTQIAFLVDAWRGRAREYSFVHYGLFVTWFPHLIAGPILHHGEMMPQFARAGTYQPDYSHVAAGLTIFVIGLFKKVLIADGVAPYVGPVFDASAAGLTLTFLEAWCGALAYTFQLYFDFSGYSDMAVGLSLLFGIRLPVNFHSPYKAVNIIEFWRRWHMTLSRFLRDYLYVPLGGNRKGPARRYVNLIVTMLLGGLWHGAGWPFVVWGGLHGAYLVVNHAWRALRARLGHDLSRSTRWGRAAGCLFTFAAVVCAWVVFRAADLDSAGAILSAMAGMNGLMVPDVWQAKWGGFGEWLAQHGVAFGATPALARTGVVYWIGILLAIVWLAPNTQEIMAAAKPALGVPPEAAPARWQWRPTATSAAAVAAMALVVIVNLNRHSEFLYFQF
jgi:D-alanyl-lipoteichoic acid acyltransferase DltB (MBOAT superfamily)